MYKHYRSEIKMIKDEVANGQEPPEPGTRGQTGSFPRLSSLHVFLLLCGLQLFYLLEERAKTPIEIATCYGCGVTKKAVMHQFEKGTAIRQEVDLIKAAIDSTGQGPPEITQVGASKGQSCDFLPLLAQHVFIQSFAWAPQIHVA